MERAVRTPRAPAGAITADRYFALVDEGLLDADDRVELLEGVVVAMSPQNPRHAAAVSCVSRVLVRAIGEQAAIRAQLPLILGRFSVPEPDIAVVAGREADYFKAHPTGALLVVEVADSSLQQDRLSKLGIYAAAGVPEVWIVNLRKNCVEVHRSPIRATRRYGSATIASRSETLAPVSFPEARIELSEILPISATE